MEKCIFLYFFCQNICTCQKKAVLLHPLSLREQPIREDRAFSSAGLEHLPYKQRVGGSNPSTPTQKINYLKINELLQYLYGIGAIWFLKTEN